MLDSRWLVKLWQSLCCHSALSKRGCIQTCAPAMPDRSKVESHPGCSSCSALGAHAPGAELEKPVRYFGEKHPGCPHCNRRLGKQGHRIELYVWRHRNCAPAYSSTASSAPGRKNSEVSFLATTISWTNSYEFDSMLLMHRLLFPYKITNWILNWYD